MDTILDKEVSVESKSPKEKPKNTERAIVQSSLVIYSAMAGIGLLIAKYVHANLATSFAVPEDQALILRYAILAALGTGVLLILTYLFEEYLPSFSELRRIFADMIGRCSVPTLFYLAALSSIGEEILFRGAIQPSLGILGTSLLFGLLHLGPTGRISSWSFWAALAGALLGWMFWVTQSLWPPILCHFAVNLISMLRLKSIFKETEKVSKSPDENASGPARRKKEELYP